MPLPLNLTVKAFSSATLTSPSKLSRLSTALKYQMLLNLLSSKVSTMLVMDRVFCKPLLPADCLKAPTVSAVFSAPPTISQHSGQLLNVARTTIARSLLSVPLPRVEVQVLLLLEVLLLAVLLPGVPPLPEVLLLLLEALLPGALPLLEVQPLLLPEQVVTRLLVQPLLLLLPPPLPLRRQVQLRQVKLELALQQRPVAQRRLVERKQAVVDGKVGAAACEYDDLLELRAVFAGVVESFVQHPTRCSSGFFYFTFITLRADSC